MSVRGLANAVVVFMMAALVGPLIVLATWPLAPLLLTKWPSIILFLSKLVSLLWPTQPLAVIEHSSGSAVALLIAGGANVVLFGILGLAVGAASRWTFALLGIYLLVAALLCLLSLWGAGFDFSYLNILAVAIGLAFYAFLFWLSTRIASK
jgi:hypothetical protein